MAKADPDYDPKTKTYSKAHNEAKYRKQREDAEKSGDVGTLSKIASKLKGKDKEKVTDSTRAAAQKAMGENPSEGDARNRGSAPGTLKSRIAGFGIGGGMGDLAEGMIGKGASATAKAFSSWGKGAGRTGTEAAKPAEDLAARVKSGSPKAEREAAKAKAPKKDPFEADNKKEAARKQPSSKPTTAPVAEKPQYTSPPQSEAAKSFVKNVPMRKTATTKATKLTGKIADETLGPVGPVSRRAGNMTNNSGYKKPAAKEEEPAPKATAAPQPAKTSAPQPAKSAAPKATDAPKSEPSAAPAEAPKERPRSKHTPIPEGADEHPSLAAYRAAKGKPARSAAWKKVPQPWKQKYVQDRDGAKPAAEAPAAEAAPVKEPTTKVGKRNAAKKAESAPAAEAPKSKYKDSVEDAFHNPDKRDKLNPAEVKEFASRYIKRDENGKPTLMTPPPSGG